MYKVRVTVQYKFGADGVHDDLNRKEVISITSKLNCNTSPLEMADISYSTECGIVLFTVPEELQLISLV